MFVVLAKYMRRKARLTRSPGRLLSDARPHSVLRAPELLEARQLFAATSGPGRDTDDPLMRPPSELDGSPNPQWNMEKIQAYQTWGLYTGRRESVVVVQDYGVDFRHEDLGATQSQDGNLWDYGQIHSTKNENWFTFSERGRDDFEWPVNVPLQQIPTDWNEQTKPLPGQYFGNVSAGIIGAATNNGIGVAGINWETSIYSSKVVENDTTHHDHIAVRSNRVIQWLRAGTTNRDHEVIRAVSFGYSSARDYGDIFNVYQPAPEPLSAANVQLRDEGHYDFISLGKGIANMPERDATWGILVTVPTGDKSLDPSKPDKLWPLSNGITTYYSAGKWSVRSGVYSPGSVDNVIAVAATDINDRPWVGNARNPVDIYAPGVDVWSLAEQSDSYKAESGTRQAQAHVAGAIALIYDAAGEHGKTLTYHEVRKAIIEGGDDIGLDKPRLNVAGALKYLGLDKRPVPNLTGVSITGGSAMEGNQGVSAAMFTLQLAKAVEIPTTIVVAIEDGTARRADRDFVLPAGGKVTVTIPAGQAAATFSVNVVGDTRAESNEVFTAKIVAVSGKVVSGYAASATWTIINDDTLPALSIQSAVASEGSTTRPGIAQAIVRLDKPSEQPISVEYSLVSGTAISGVDFLPSASRFMIVPARRTAAPITVRLVGNEVVGPDRSFQVRIDSVANASMPIAVAGRTAAVTIIDDDKPTVLVQPTSAYATSEASTLVFLVRLSKPAAAAVTVGFATRNGSGAQAAIAGVDYDSLANTVVFAPGETSKRIEITLLSRRSGQRYPKDFYLDLIAVSANAAFKPGVGGQSVIGRIL